MKKYMMGISAAAIVALAAGCGGGDVQDRTTARPTTGVSAAHNEQDVAFARMMVPHHQQAVDMARTAAGKATDPKVKDLATRIEGAQDPEIRQLTAMLDKWGAPTGSSMPGMAHGTGDGMMTDAEMGQLEQSSGADFDRLWLQLMVRHHQGAVTMARTEVDAGTNTEAKALAQRIIDAQRAEISEMQGMLA